MAAKSFRYVGNKITVQYDPKRCIHAAECVRGLHSVFNTVRKPWVDPDGAGADEVAAVVMWCPSGALHFKRRDGGPDEPVPSQNAITPVVDGPLHLRGDLQLSQSDGSLLAADTRMTLCRCGGSQNKPFCDGSHAKINFRHDGSLGNSTAKTESGIEGSGLLITPLLNGPLAVKGEMQLVSADGSSTCQGNKLFLCRCGASHNKPFCDGSHNLIDFVAE